MHYQSDDTYTRNNKKGKNVEDKTRKPETKKRSCARRSREVNVMFIFMSLIFFGFIIFLVVKFIKGAIDETKYRINEEGTKFYRQKHDINRLKEENKELRHRITYLEWLKKRKDRK